jgi:hypothetical protein
MKVFTITADELNGYMTQAMISVVDYLLKDNRLSMTQEEAERFLDTHVVQFCTNDSIFKRWAGKFFPDLRDDEGVISIVTVPPATAKAEKE